MKARSERARTGEAPPTTKPVPSGKEIRVRTKMKAKQTSAVKSRADSPVRKLFT